MHPTHQMMKTLLSHISRARTHKRLGVVVTCTLFAVVGMRRAAFCGCRFAFRAVKGRKGCIVNATHPVQLHRFAPLSEHVECAAREYISRRLSVLSAPSDLESGSIDAHTHTHTRPLHEYGAAVAIAASCLLNLMFWLPVHLVLFPCSLNYYQSSRWMECI